MRHVYRCPLRWADLDAQGHIANVTYADYLQEARIDMLSGHRDVVGGRDLAEGVVVTRHEIDFVAALHYRPEPVNVAVWVSEVRAATFTLGYEIYDDASSGSAGPTTYLRGLSVLAPFVFADETPRRVSAQERESLGRFAGEPVRRSGRVDQAGTNQTHDTAIRVRFSDVDTYGHVNNVRYLEFFQEARIDHARQHGLSSPSGGWVVANTVVDYLRPVAFRHAAYVVRSWISDVGTSSITWGMHLIDPDTDDVLARARVVNVHMDLATGRPRALDQVQRAAIEVSRRSS